MLLSEAGQTDLGEARGPRSDVARAHREELSIMTRDQQISREGRELFAAVDDAARGAGDRVRETVERDRRTSDDFFDPGACGAAEAVDVFTDVPSIMLSAVEAKIDLVAAAPRAFGDAESALESIVGKALRRAQSKDPEFRQGLTDEAEGIAVGDAVLAVGRVPTERIDAEHLSVDVHQ